MIVLNIVMRFLHILSAVALVGGAIAWKMGFLVGTEELATDTRARVGDKAAAAWRPVVLISIAAILISGMWNYMTKTGMPPIYHAVLGVKILLALHVIGVCFLVTQPGNEKRGRQLTGVVISGLLIVAMAAFLRQISIP